MYKPPEKTPVSDRIGLFLGGSIEMGVAEDWQTILNEEISDFWSDLDVYNPRRDEWDNSWKQDISDPYFKAQVEWELDHIEKSKIVVLYFDPSTKSPISLLELGLLCGSDKREKTVLVCCPDGFWRKGNVQIVCDRYGIAMSETFSDLVKAVRSSVKSLIKNQSGFNETTAQLR
jgi:hypothetical protein